MTIDKATVTASGSSGSGSGTRKTMRTTATTTPSTRLLASFGAVAKQPEGLDVLRQAILDWAFDYLEVNNEPCHFDHHGGCQAHGYLEPEEPFEDACPTGDAQDAYQHIKRLATADPAAT